MTGTRNRKPSAQHISSETTSVRIGLLGMYASANLGDTAIQSVVLKALRARRPDIEFIGLTADPEDVVRTHGIPAFPTSGEGPLVIPERTPPSSHAAQTFQTIRGRGPALFRRTSALRNIDRQIRDLDMLIVSGGGQLDDFWGGPWYQPFRLFAWCTAARRRNKAIAVFAVGVDDLCSRISGWLAISALKMARYRTFRDKGSLDLLRQRGFTAAADLCPDPAFAMGTPPSEVDISTGKTARYAIISPISQHAYPGTTADAYDAYLDTLAIVAQELRAQGLGVRFACSQTKMDPPVASRIMSRVEQDTEISVADINNVDDFLQCVSRAELVIASRLHALILSLAAGTPIIAISNARKVKQQMIDVGLEEYYFELGSRNTHDLLSRVAVTLQRRADISSHISSQVADLRSTLDHAFDQLAAIIPAPRPQDER